jgi:hypothetical protein
VLTGTHVWGEGNILLGGGGDDVIEGRGGNDIIDGDRYLSVRLSVRTDADDASTEIGSATSMSAQYKRDSAGALTGPTLQQSVFAGDVDPANIIVVREILTSAEGTDSAAFSDFEFNYTVTTTGGDGTMGSPGAVTTVQHIGGDDGTDTLYNIELLVFGNGTAPNGGDDGVEDEVEDDGIDEVEDGVDEGTDEGTGGGIDVIPGDGEVIVVVTPAPDTAPLDPAPVDPAPADPAPADPAPVDPAPLDPAPVDPAPADPAPADPAPLDPAPVDPAPADPAPVNPAPASDATSGGFSVRTVDSTGTQVGDIQTAETGATSMVVRGLENGAAYRFQVAPAGGGNEPQFSDLSEPVVPGATEDERRTFNKDTAGPSAAGPGTQQPLAQMPAPFGGVFGTAAVVTLAAMAQYLATDPGTAALAVTTGGLLAACALLAYKLHRLRANTRKALSKEAASSTNA